MPYRLLVICDACHKTAVYQDELRRARRAAVKDGWKHNRAADEIERVWWCPGCGERMTEQQRKQVRAT